MTVVYINTDTLLLLVHYAGGNAKVAKKAGVHPYTISEIIRRGTCSPDVAEWVAGALKVPVEEIVLPIRRYVYIDVSKIKKIKFDNCWGKMGFNNASKLSRILRNGRCQLTDAESIARGLGVKLSDILKENTP